MTILRAITDAGHVLDFSEHGHQQPNTGKKELGGMIGNLIEKHLELGGSLEGFFSENPELGEMNEYDLSEYKEKTK